MSNQPQDSVPPTPPDGPPALHCPMCGNTSFQREESRQDSRWGMTNHVMTLLICNRCRFVSHFYDSNSIWDFG